VKATAQVLRVLTRESWDETDLQRFDAYWRDAARSELFGGEFEDARRITHCVEAGRRELLALRHNPLRPSA
jgi:hypothetical protein